MEVTSTQTQARVPVTIFHVSGKFNSSEPLAGMAMQAFQDGARYMLIDLSEVEYVSSAGLRSLHQIYNMLRDQTESAETVSQGLRAGSYHSPHLKLLKPSKLVVDVLKTTGFDMFLEIHKSRKKALASF